MVTIILFNRVKSSWHRHFYILQCFSDTHSMPRRCSNSLSVGINVPCFRPFNVVPHTEPQEDPEPFKFQPEGEFCLSYFDTIVPIHSVNMGYFALGYKSGVGANVNKYLLKRLFKSTIASQNTVKHVLDEAKILEAMNCLTVYNSVMQILWCNV